MKVYFGYNEEKDIWCLLHKGRGSDNSETPTQPYEQLIKSHGETLTPESVSSFLEQYLSDEQIDIKKYIDEYQKDWDEISDEYQRRAEAIFGVSLPNDICAYLTVSPRCPYNIEKNFYFVSMPTVSARKKTMHELWHFYTWYGLGIDQEERLGRNKYNILKEALTVLLNVEFKDLLPEGIIDRGYPQHKEIRDKILEFWARDRNITNLWNYLKNESLSH